VERHQHQPPRHRWLRERHGYVQGRRQAVEPLRRQLPLTVLHRFPRSRYWKSGHGDRWNHYAANYRSQSYIASLAAVTGNPATGIGGLIQTIQGGQPHLQGTWIHPRLAVDLARWISPAFAVWMDGWFLEELTGQPQAQPQPRRQRRPQPDTLGEAYWNFWDTATRPQAHGQSLVECLAQDRARPGHRMTRHRIRHHAQRILDFFPELSVREQLAPVVELLQEAAYRLEQVEEPMGK
jgi:hypothetical protein